MLLMIIMHFGENIESRPEVFHDRMLSVWRFAGLEGNRKKPVQALSSVLSEITRGLPQQYNGSGRLLSWNVKETGGHGMNGFSKVLNFS